MVAIAVGLAAVSGLTAVLLRMRSARKRALAAAAETVPHLHYCAECDEEWPHHGRTCLKPWALLCPSCDGTPSGADLPARSPA